MTTVRPQSVVAAVCLSTVAAVAIAGGADHDKPEAGLIVFAMVMGAATWILVAFWWWAEGRQRRYREHVRARNAARREYVDPETVASERVARAAAERAAAVQAEEDALIKARKAKPKRPQFIVLTDVRTVGSEVAL